MKKNLMQIICFMLAVIVGLGSVSMVPAMAASKDTITIDAFVKKLEKAVGKKGLLKDGEYSNVNNNIKRVDAAVLTNRADEVLNGASYSKDLYNQVVNKKRVTGLKNISTKEKEAIRKCFVKGLMQGYSNGKCSQDRSFKPEQFLTVGEADKIIERLRDKKKRVKLSPDGQVVRTTNLPKNYKKFDYILASFPNEFYEKKFLYQRTKYSYEPVNLEDYASPKDMKKVLYNTGYEKLKFTNMYDQYGEQWLDIINTNLKYRLNFDYRKVDNKWVNNLLNTYYLYDEASIDKKRIDHIKKYVKNAKKNKVIVKSADIVVEPSTIYMKGGGLFIRCYLKFKVSANTLYQPESNRQNELIYSSDLVWLEGLKKNKWYEGYFDFGLSGAAFGDTGDAFRINWDDLWPWE